jgi:tetratricopeptide (TPR) repeat protein/glycosyltransferase involved in cell wall biosynthesis
VRDASRPALLVLQVGPPEPTDAATAIYRTVQPCRALGELADVAVISGSVLSPELYQRGAGGDLLMAADVLVIRDVADADLLPVLALRRREGRLTVFEPGQRLLPGPPGEIDGDLATRGLGPQLGRLADGLQLAGAGLEAQLDGINPRRALLPSQLWDAPPAAPRPREGTQVTIGWVGTAAERDDLATVVPALAGVLERHPEVRLALLGDPGLDGPLAQLPRDRVSLERADSLADAQRFLERLDIGIVPLAPEPDRFVSDVRALEFAAHSVLAICADAEPFRDLIQPGHTGFLFRDAAELETLLDRTLADPQLRAGVVTRALRAAGERLERRQSAHRLGFYLSLAAQRGTRWSPKGANAGASWLEAAGPALRFAGSRYAALGSGPVERLLVEGARRRAAGDRAEACRLFAEAERAAPTSHLPPLQLGITEPDPSAAIAALARAEGRRPTSCQAAYQRGLRELERGDQAAAAADFERARSIAPTFGAPQERLGALAEKDGRLPEAARLYEEAALQNPSFALPVVRLALLAQGRRELGRAAALLERALAADPALGLTHFLLARVSLESGRLHQARAQLERSGADATGGWRAQLPPDLETALPAAEAVREALARAENRG